MGSNDATPGTAAEGAAPLSLEAWRLVRQMLDDMTAMVRGRGRDRARAARGAPRARPGHRAVLGAVARRRRRVALVLQHEHRGPPHRRAQPRRRVPPGHDRRRATATGSAAAAGRSPTSGSRCWPAPASPRAAWRAYVSDTDLDVADDGTLRASSSRPSEPSADELAGAPVGADPRRRLGHRGAPVRRRPVGRGAGRARRSSRSTRRACPPGPPTPSLAEQLTAMAWTIAKLTTLHQTIRPELLDQPNELSTAEAAELGAADTTPDNLYMLGTFRLDRRARPCVLDIDPPAHPVLERHAREHLARVHRRPPTAQLADQRHGRGRAPTAPVRVVIAAADPGRGQLARHRRPPPRVRHAALARPPRRPGGHAPGSCRTPRSPGSWGARADEPLTPSTATSSSPTAIAAHRDSTTSARPPGRRGSTAPRRPRRTRRGSTSSASTSPPARSSTTSRNRLGIIELAARPTRRWPRAASTDRS